MYEVTKHIMKKTKKVKLTKERLKKLLSDRYTLEEIGAMFGVTRQAISYHIKKYKIR